MSAIRDVVDAHKKRIRAEVEAALWHGSAGFRGLGRQELERFVSEAIDAMVARAEQPDDRSLVHLVETTAQRGEVALNALCGALVRMSLALRSVLLVELTNRRAAAIASGAVDRAVAETLESVALQPAERRITNNFTRVMEARDPTILRNIREVLSQQRGAVEEATVLVASLRVQSREGVLDVAALAELGALRDLCVNAFKQVGAGVCMAHVTTVAACLPARVDDTDVADGVGLLVGLARMPELAACAFAAARGTVVIELAGDAQEHVASGEPLRRALGLASSARDHEILADGKIAAAAESSFVFRPLGDHAYRLDLEQPQWLDRWEEAALVLEPGFVGRDETRRELVDALRARNHRVVMVGVRGAVGAGKHRLLDEALAELEIGEDRVLVGEPHAMTHEPYWLVSQVIRQALGVRDEPLERDALRGHLESLAADVEGLPVQSLSRTLEALLAVESRAPNESYDLEPSVVRGEIAKAFRVLLEAVAARRADKPLVLVLRDADRIDGPTAHALAQVIHHYRSDTTLYIVLTYRGVLRPPAVLRDAAFREVTLPALGKGAVAELVTSMLDADDLAPKLVKLVQDRAEGSPLAATMLVRYLVESGGLERQGGGWRLSSSFDEASLPRRLATLIARRIEHLPARLAALLKTSATLGEPLAWRSLELAWVSLGLPRDTLEQSIGLLEEMGFLRRTADQSARFAHPLLRQVAYRMQSDAERREAHRLAVIAYRERYPDAVAQVPAVLFRHFMEAGDVEGAREAAVHAVRRAVLLQDGKGALALAQEGLLTCADGSVPSRRARFDILAAREQVHDSRGARTDQKRDIRELSTLAEALEDQHRMGLAMHRAARLNLLLGDLGKAGALAEKALHLLRGRDPVDVSNALRTVALVRWQRRDAPAAAAALREALEIYETLGHRRGMGFVLHNLGLFALDTGAIGQARSHFERALKLKRATDDHHGSAVLLDALGQVALLEGDPITAMRSFREAITLHDETGDVRSAAGSRVSLGEAVLTDDPVQAEQLARTALRAVQTKRRHARTAIAALILLGRALLAQGHKEDATKPVQRAVKRAQELEARLLLVQARLAEAEVSLAFRSKKRVEHAIAQAQQAVDTSLAVGALRWRVEAMSWLALAKARLGAADAEAIAQQVLDFLTERTPVGLDVASVKARCQAALAAAEAV